MKVLLILITVLGLLTFLYYFLKHKNNNIQDKKVKIGATAPLFTLPDENNKERSLSEFKGKKIVLYFYPKDETPGCTVQACGLRDSFDDFKKHNIVVLGVSYDTPESHKKFKEKEHLPFILLSDTNRKVAHMYGTDQHAMGSLYPSRTTFLINEEGNIQYIIENVTPSTHTRDVLKAFGY